MATRPSISKRRRLPSLVTAGMMMFAVCCATTPVRAQPAQPTMADCMTDAARFDPSNAKLVARIMACDPKHAAENIARLSARARANATTVQSESGAARISETKNQIPIPAQPLAYYINGAFMSPDRMKSFAFDGSKATNAVAVPDAATLNFIVADAKKQQLQSAAFNASASADTAGQNEAVRQAELKRKCDYKTTSLGALSSLASLSSNSPIYTRTQLGILSAIIPVLFSHCDTTTPPAKPVLSLSGDSVEQGGTIKLTALEKGYTGSFTASSSDPNTAKIQDPTSQTVADGTNGTVAGSATFTVKADDTASGTVTLTITDDRGTKSTISLVISPKKAGS